MRCQNLLLISCVLIALGSCSKRETALAPSPPPTASAQPTPRSEEKPLIEDPCALLTGEEIEAATGAAMKEAIPQRAIEDGFVIAQCNFTMPVLTDSVTLRVIQRGSDANARDPRQVWQETFARDLERAIKERKEGPPVRVGNLGDEAFWMGGPELGGLYVLKGNRYFRLGIGGEPNQEVKIEKATKLAQAILARM
jgi:hypothetical protein